MILSYFTSTYAPYIEIPNAPIGNNKIHYPLKNIEFTEILKIIHSAEFESKIEMVQKSPENKKLLPCFLPSGVFRFRNDNELLQYSGMVVLDFDKLESVYKTKQAIKQIPYTFAAFISPSYKGLKVFVKHNQPAAQHKQVFKQIAKHYESILGIAPDASGSNISRLCYISSDRDLFYNRAHQIFDFKKPIIETKELPSSYKFLIDFTAEKAGNYEQSNRNSFIFLLANNCNRYGLTQYAALAVCRTLWLQDNANFSETQLTATVASAYARISEHNTFKMPQ